jgi:hypothetical protein
VLLDFADASLLVAQSLGRVVPAQFLDQCHRVPRDVPREVDGVDSLQDDVVRLHGVGSRERGCPCQQLEHQHAQRPVVGADVMALVQDHFRGDVFGGAAERPRLSTAVQLLGEAEVHQFHVALVVQQKIFRFQVSENKRKIFYGFIWRKTTDRLKKRLL